MQGNLILTAILAIIDPNVVGCPKGGSHTIFGEEGTPALVIHDSPFGVLFIGPYDKLLHSNLATYIDAGSTRFPWYRHSTSWYLKRTVVQHHLNHGVYSDKLALLAALVLDKAESSRCDSRRAMTAAAPAIAARTAAVGAAAAAAAAAVAGADLAASSAAAARSPVLTADS